MTAPRPSLDGDREVDALYAQPPEAFVVARDELAKRRKADGRADEAAAIKALRRPSVAAWAVNQVVRRWPADVDELLGAADELRGLQRRAASGVRAEGFRRATDRRRRAVASLAHRADDVLAERGRASPGVSEAAEATFEAASIDEEAGTEVRSGRLTKELLASSGFGGVGGLDVVPSTPKTKAKGTGEAGDADRSGAQRRERAAAEARRAAMKARADADRLTERADRLAAEAGRARTLAQKARDEATAARAEAARAERAARRAERAAER